VAPSVGSGVVFIEGGDRWGLCVVRSAAVAETYAFDEGARSTGDVAIARMQEWLHVELSAWRMQERTLDLVPMLLHARQLHQRLSLAWTSWEGLLSDLRGRKGTFVVEIRCDLQRGVTCIRDGEHVASYCDAHPEPGDLSLLDDMVGPDSTVTVFRASLPYDSSLDRPTRRDAADALAWHITRKAGNGTEERFITAPFAFHGQPNEHDMWFAEAPPAKELRGQVQRLQINTSES
jgi:hypothetical protein